MTLILFALAVLGIMTIVALVLDLSGVRNTRQDSKLTTDAVAAAGLQSLAPDAVPRPWRAACAALTYLKSNQPDLSLTVTYKNGAGTVLAASPCSGSLATSAACKPYPAFPDKATWAWIEATDGDFKAEIKSGYVMPDPAFPEDASVYVGDDGEADNGGCDHLAVIIDNKDPALFGGAAGASGYETSLRSVGRIQIELQPDGTPAFLMLERTKCGALSESVGSGESGIRVRAVDSTEGGFIHVDSAGLRSTGCDGNNNSGGWAVYSSGSSGPKIVAEPGIDPATGIVTPGKIAVYSLRLGEPPTYYGGATAAGLSPAPTPGWVVSRQPVDKKYNPDADPTTPALVPTITNLHAVAAVDANRTVAPAGYTTVACGADGDITTATDLVFVDCTGGYSPTAANFTNATDIIFNGPVQVQNNNSLFMPNATRVVIGGTTTRGLEVSGRLGINSNVFADTDAATTGACAGREGAGFIPTPATPWTRTARLIVFGGSSSGAGQGGLNISGRAALCQTFVYMAGPKSNGAYVRQAITDGTYHSSCTSLKPCPKGSTEGNTISNAQLIVQGLLQWSAPNQSAVAVAEGAPAGVEDLALWSETHSTTEVKSGGTVLASGVFFLPNARVEMRSPAVANPQDAQFISRSMALLQGSLTMKPTGANVVQIPVLGEIRMVR
jgi:hypothetical protein